MNYKRIITQMKGGFNMNATLKLLIAITFFGTGCTSSYYASDYADDDIYSSAMNIHQMW